MDRRSPNGRPAAPSHPSLTTADKLAGAGAVAAAAPDPEVPAARPPKDKLSISTQFVRRGRVFTVTLATALDPVTIDRLCDRLDKLGLDPVPLPVATSPNGEPICPRHGVAMRGHEKQGDTWYSHKLEDSQGREHWCRGRAGGDSPGWEVPGGSWA